MPRAALNFSDRQEYGAQSNKRILNTFTPLKKPRNHKTVNLDAILNILQNSKCKKKCLENVKFNDAIDLRRELSNVKINVSEIDLKAVPHAAPQ